MKKKFNLFLRKKKTNRDQPGYNPRVEIIMQNL